MINPAFLEGEIESLKKYGYLVSHANRSWWKEYIELINKCVPNLKIIECYYRWGMAQIIYIPDHKCEALLYDMLKAEAEDLEKKAKSIRDVLTLEGKK